MNSIQNFFRPVVTPKPTQHKIEQKVAILVPQTTQTVQQPPTTKKTIAQPKVATLVPQSAPTVNNSKNKFINKSNRIIVTRPINKNSQIGTRQMKVVKPTNLLKPIRRF